MTDVLPVPRARDRLDGLVAPRRSAFPEALRHTTRVARLRRWILWGAGGVVGIVGLGLLISSLRFLPADLSLGARRAQGLPHRYRKPQARRLSQGRASL